MRYYASLIFALILFGFTSSKSISIEGVWIPQSQELNGKALPKSVYEKQKLIIHDSTYTVIAESVDKGVIELHGQRMDIFGREGVNAGKHITAIYKMENEQLVICYNLNGNGYPEGFETKDKPRYFMSVFKRDSAK